MKQYKAEKLFIIRDDDLNYFHSLEDIKRVYHEVFAMGVPVGFSTIPFVTNLSDLHIKNQGEQGKEYAISENKELVDFINKNPLIEIMLHGCNHENNNNQFEYQAPKGLFEKTLRGKQELEKAFGNVSVFVPPHDQISNHGILAIENAKLDIIRSKGMKNFLPRISYAFVLCKMIIHRLKFAILQQEMPPYPHTINLGSHKEAFSVRIELGFDKLAKMMKSSVDQNGNVVMVTHINDMDETKKQTLIQVTNEAKRLGFKCAYPHELFYETKN